MKRMFLGLADPCALNPQDPICQEFYGNTPTQGSTADYAYLSPFQIMPGTYVQPGTAPPPPTSSTPTAPGTIVSTTDEAGFMGFWNKIPLPVKLVGAGLLAFVGYKKLTK